MAEQKNRRKSIVSIVMVVITIALIVVGFTYAYFTANTIIGNELFIKTNISEEAIPVFSAYTSGDLHVSVTSADMLDTSASEDNTSIADSDTQILYVNLLGGTSDNPAKCTFDMYWENLGTTYTPSSGVTSDMKEYTLEIIDGDGYTMINEVRIDTLQKNMDEDNIYILESDLGITSTGTLTEKKFIIYVRLYNLNIPQTIYNKTYSSRISVTNIEC